MEEEIVKIARDPVVVEEEIVKIAIVKRTNVECTRNISVCCSLDCIIL